jgi:hypothetical protein
MDNNLVDYNNIINLFNYKLKADFLWLLGFINVCGCVEALTLRYVADSVWLLQFNTLKFFIG